jgi:hypothetical protein
LRREIEKMGEKRERLVTQFKEKEDLVEKEDE